MAEETEALKAFLGGAAAALLPDAVDFDGALAAAGDALDSFAKESATTLFVATLAGGAVTIRIEPSGDAETAALCIVKRRPGAALVPGKSVAKQVQVLSLQRDASEPLFHDVHHLTRHAILPAVRHRSSALRPDGGYTGAADASSGDAVQKVQKKMKELDMAFLQCSQRQDIPTVSIDAPPPVVQHLRAIGPEAVSKAGLDTSSAAASKGLTDGELSKIRLESLQLEARVADTEFVELATQSTQAWGREIQKVVGVVAQFPSPNGWSGPFISLSDGGSAGQSGAWIPPPFPLAEEGSLEALRARLTLNGGMKLETPPVFEEVQFWGDIEKVLAQSEEELLALPVLVTLRVLQTKAGWHRSVVEQLRERWRELRHVHKAVATIASTLQDAYTPAQGPGLHDFLTSSDLEEVTASIPTIFDQARRLAQHTRYGAERTAELLQSATFSLLLHVEAEYEQSQVLRLPYGDFQEAHGRFLNILMIWDRHFRSFRDVLPSEAGEEGRSIKQKLAQTRMARKALEDRLDEVYEFRVQHEKLRRTLVAVLQAQKETEMHAIDRADEIDKAFGVFCTGDSGSLLNTQDDGFATRRAAYDRVIRGVDDKLIEVMRDCLQRAKSAEERFRAFDAFNPLFFRERVRAAIAEYQAPLIESVREAVQALQEKFTMPYSVSSAGMAASARDLPAVASELLWARQVKAQLDALMRRTEDVLGAEWRLEPAGKELARKFNHITDLLNNRKLFKDWLTSWNDRIKKDLEPARQARERHVLLVSRSRHGSRRLEVNFDKSKMELFKEVRNLRQIEAEQRIPPSIETMALAAKKRYAIAMALQATLETYYNSRLTDIDTAWLACADGQQFDISALLIPETKLFRENVERAFLVSGQVRSLMSLDLSWNDYESSKAESLRSWTVQVHQCAVTLEEKISGLGSAFLDITELLRELQSCPYLFQSIERRVQKIQGIVDELDEAGYSNLHDFVALVNGRLEELFKERLEDAIRVWRATFDADGDASDKNTLLLQYRVNLEIGLQESILHASPSVEEAGQAFWKLLEGYLGTVLLQRQILPGSLRAKSRGEADVPFKAAVLGRMGLASLGEVYAVTTSVINKCKEYVRGWLRYQALWDMSMGQLVEALGDDATSTQVLQNWASVIKEAETARAGLERSLEDVRFGPIYVNYSQVQERVISRYASWAVQLQSTFADLGQRAANALLEHLGKTRAVMEAFRVGSLDVDTIDGICKLQDFRQEEADWRARVGVISAGEKLLRRLRYKLGSEWVEAAAVMSILSDVHQILDRRAGELDTRLTPLLAELVEEAGAVSEAVDSTASAWAEEKPEGDAAGVESTSSALSVLHRFKEAATSLRARLDQGLRAQRALRNRLEEIQRPAGEAFDAVDLEAADQRLRTVEREHERLMEVWGRLHTIWENVSTLGKTEIGSLKPLQLRLALEQILASQLLNREVCPTWLTQYAPYQRMLQKVRSYVQVNSLINEVVSAPLKARHWKVICKSILNTRTSHANLTVAVFWGAELEDHKAALTQILLQAQGENAIEEFLTSEVRDFWQSFKLSLVPFQNRVYLISCFDVLFEKLEEHGSGLDSMKQSPHFKNVLEFQQDARIWEERIGKLQAIFDTWVDVQRRWVYLVGIFSGASDIKAQLPTEYNLFRGVDSDFARLHKKVLAEPSCMEILEINASNDSLLKQLDRMQAIMQKTQKALGEYLERQRQQFARFYFVGDDNLLEVVGNSGEPQKVAQHLSKMFAAIVGVGIVEEGGSNGGNKLITSMSSREGESVQFSSAVVLTESTAAKDWLSQLEKRMKETLCACLVSALDIMPKLQDQSNSEALCKWLESFPAQVVTLAQQLQWSAVAEEALSSGKSSVEGVLTGIDGRLQILAQTVLRDLDRPLRKKCEHLIMELVHKRDVQRALCQDTVPAVTDFRWQKNMRFYGKDGDIEVRMANADFGYGYEYLGVGERLVTTPLTDRCYLTLTQALQLRMGGNPFGPAGTGKTESVKSLGGLLGLWTLVFNCDEAFDYAAMGRIFVGLCQVGAWGCFDEFNRLEERILSAISQQILTIQQGLQAKARQIPLCGKSVTLNPKVGIFVTMNPGYAGRSNLPDNLKRLFRAVAMVHPDSQLIAQVMLFGQGLEHAEPLSARVVSLFDLCKQKLTDQTHYDFGLRALKSVLVGAGHLKRASLDKKEFSDTGRDAEEMAMIRSVCSTMVPKLVQQDRDAFYEILRNSFPDADLSQIYSHDANIRQKLVNFCEAQSLLASESWLEKVMQLYNVINMRHGVMLVGASGSGKSQALRFLRDNYCEVDPAIHKVEMHVIDPKAMNKEELYGVLDPTTLEWTDGVFTRILREVLDNKRGSTNRLHWIVFDGDVDPEWAENLNSVLDDNKLLTLPNGERLAVPANVRIFMEVDSLEHATPATVSRCGMIWFSNDTVSKRMLLWKALRGVGPAEGETQQRILDEYISTLTPFVVPENDADESLAAAALSFALREGCEHVMDVTPIQLILSLRDLLQRGFELLVADQESHPDFPVDANMVSSYAGKYLVFALTWSFGASSSWSCRAEIANFIRDRSTIPLPEDGVLNYFVRPSDGEWEAWSAMVPKVQLEPHEVRNADVIITTTDVVRHREVLHAWLQSRRSLLLCGPPGSGKTMTLSSTLRQMTNVVLAELNFSSGTSSDLLLKTFHAYCEEVRSLQGTFLQPKADFGPDTWLVVFCDEINLPAPDDYGTQKVISFMRQIIEQGGFYGKNTQFMKLRRVQFVGACNPPKDVGRHALSDRFLCLAPVLLVDFPSGESLQQIYSTFNTALLKLHPNLRGQWESLTTAMIEVYDFNQENYKSTEQPQYFYSPRELSRWVRGLYETLDQMENASATELVRIWAHEAHRLFCDRLVDESQRIACARVIADVAKKNFAGVDIHEALAEPILFSDWLDRIYRSEEREALSSFVRAKLKVFYEEELDVPLVVFDDVIDHVLRIDRVLKQPMGHLLLVGDAGVGKTVLSRFTAWINGLSSFQVKAHANYTIESFDEDLRSCMKRVGVRNEKLCFIFDESNALDSGFLERMNALLASGDVPGLFEGDEFATLMSNCREASGQDASNLGSAFVFDSSDSDEELFRKFTRKVQRNMHVVFTMNPATTDFKNRSTTSPALYNRCVVDWFGTWSDVALTQVGYELGAVDTDLGGGDEEAATYEPPIGSGDALEIVSSLLKPDEVVTLSHGLTAAMVEIHKQVKEVAGGTTRYLSPRDYLELLRSFGRIAKDRRSDLEEQAMHIGQGLNKLEDASKSVAELQASMRKKATELETQDAAANEKLQQMVGQQNEAEQRKTEADRLRTELEERGEELALKKEPIEKELQDVEPTLRAAQNSVEDIKKPQLDEVRTLSRPPAIIKAVLEIVMVMLKEKANDWTDVRKVLRRDDFISSVVNYNPESVTPGQIRKIHAILDETNGLDEKSAQRASEACGPLFTWAKSQIQYAEILGRIQPLREEVKALEEASKELEEQRDAVMAEIAGLEETIAKLKAEYAEMIATSAKLKAEMEEVSARVSRATQLLDSLASERERWNQTQAQFHVRMRTLCGDALLCSAFLTYAGGFNVAVRKTLYEKWTSTMDTLGIPYRSELDVVEWVLPKQNPDIRVQWQSNALPQERSSFENAVIFTQGSRYPLVLDADGVAREWVRNQVETEVSFSAPHFTQTLVQAVRFGQALLITDIGNHDPVINPVLNRELIRYGGRVCLYIAGDHIDFNPNFRCVLLHSGSAADLPPDLQSRVTVVDWRISEEGLSSWVVDEVLEQEDTELVNRKKALVEEMAKEGFRLREMEKDLLERISNSEGDLLADDSLLGALQDIKNEYTTTQSKISEGQKVLEELQQQENLWSNFGGAIAAIWDALVNLGSAGSSILTELEQEDGFPRDCTYIFDDLAEFRTILREGVRSGESGGGSAQREARESALRVEILERVWRRVGSGINAKHKEKIKDILQTRIDAVLPEAAPDGEALPPTYAKAAGKPILILEEGGVGSVEGLGASATLSLGNSEARKQALEKLDALKTGSPDSSAAGPALVLQNVHYDRELLEALAKIPVLPPSLALTGEPSLIWRHFPALLRKLYIWRRQPSLQTYLSQLPQAVVDGTAPVARLRRYFVAVAVYYICVNREEKQLPPITFTFPALSLPPDEFESTGLPLLKALWIEGESGDGAESGGELAYTKYEEYLGTEALFPLSFTAASDYISALERLEEESEDGSG